MGLKILYRWILVTDERLHSRGHLFKFTVTASASFNMLSMGKALFCWFVEASFKILFKIPKAFLISLFIFFLEAQYFPPSIVKLAVSDVLEYFPLTEARNLYQPILRCILVLRLVGLLAIGAIYQYNHTNPASHWVLGLQKMKKMLQKTLICLDAPQIVTQRGEETRESRWIECAKRFLC